MSGIRVRVSVRMAQRYSTSLKHLCDILGGEELTLNARNESIISYADYAIEMVDEIEKGLLSSKMPEGPFFVIKFKCDVKLHRSSVALGRLPWCEVLGKNPASGEISRK